jgi:hypothetical protein
MAAGKKMAVFWFVAQCGWVEVYLCFKGASCFHHQRDEHFPDFMKICSMDLLMKIAGASLVCIHRVIRDAKNT